MKRIAIFLTSILLVSCELSTTEPLVITAEELLKQQTEIIQLSESVTCTNASEWKFTPMGSKACGGPSRYIAYHQSIEQNFLDLVERFTALQKSYNEQNKVLSDCMLVGPPRTVQCEGNKPVLVYRSDFL